MTIKLATDPHAIKEAIALLSDGEIVALPSETVYGLAADATNESAVAKIFEAKNRPAQNPLIVHVATIEDAKKLITFNDKALQLAQHFWPGPLTIIGALIDDMIAPNVTAGLKTLAVRVPAHTIMKDIIQKLGKPLAAPSANASGRISATSPQIVHDTLGDKAPLILADGVTDKGVESTIIKCESDDIILLRHGAISIDQIEKITGSIKDNTQTKGAPQSPGQLLRHYAPITPIRLDAVDVKKDEALLAFGSIKFMAYEKGGFIKDALPDTHILNLSEDSDIDEAAHNLFAYLHKLDQLNVTTIAIMPLPKQGLGLTLYDRLNRACQAQNMT